MNYKALLLALTFCCQSALAGPINDRFAGGVLGVPWGSPLDSIVGMFPQGEHLYATTPGERAYRVKDDQEFFGVPRSGYDVRYGLNERDGLDSVTLSFPYDRKEELLGVLIATFGFAGQQWTEGRQRVIAWGDSGIRVVLKTTIDPRHGIVWLSIFGPNKPSTLSKR